MYAQFGWVFCWFNALVFKTNRAQEINLNFFLRKQTKSSGSFWSIKYDSALTFHITLNPNY